MFGRCRVRRGVASREANHSGARRHSSRYTCYFLTQHRPVCNKAHQDRAKRLKKPGKNMTSRKSCLLLLLLRRRLDNSLLLALCYSTINMYQKNRSENSGQHGGSTLAGATRTFHVSRPLSEKANKAQRQMTHQRTRLHCRELMPWKYDYDHWIGSTAPL